VTDVVADAVTGGTIELDGYATTLYVDEAIAAIEVPTVPTNVSEFTNDAGYLTEHQDLSDYATKTYVDEAVAAIDFPETDLSDYYTKTETDEYFATIGYVDDAIADINIPDVSEFQTEEQVNALINTALGVIENGTY
jgi:hypothetical protein